MTNTGHTLPDRLHLYGLITIGGFAGANGRYLLDVLITGLPATLAANVLGSFALGLVLYGGMRSGAVSPATRALVATGFLSSFTTYSTFALQSVQASPRWLLLNVLVTYGLGFTGVLVSRSIVDRLERRWSR